MRIEDYFSQNDEPVILLDLVSASIEVLVDTGFAGSLIIPQELATNLRMSFEGFEEFYTATGHIVVAAAYSVETKWLARSSECP
jgi:predicted aspartyl protease